MTEIDKIIRTCSQSTVGDCLNKIKQLSNTERDILMRVFEFSPDSHRFGDELLVALNYMIK